MRTFLAVSFSNSFHSFDDLYHFSPYLLSLYHIPRTKLVRKNDKWFPAAKGSCEHLDSFVNAVHDLLFAFRNNLNFVGDSIRIFIVLTTQRHESFYACSFFFFCIENNVLSIVDFILRSTQLLCRGHIFFLNSRFIISMISLPSVLRCGISPYSFIYAHVQVTHTPYIQCIHIRAHKKLLGTYTHSRNFSELRYLDKNITAV